MILFYPDPYKILFDHDDIVQELRALSTFYYLGSPYSKYPAGIEAAFIEVCRIAGELIRLGIPVYSPIAHTHPVAIHAGMDPLDHTIWLPADRPMMDAASALIVAQMTGWETSYGLQHEIEVFKTAGKPIVYLQP